MKRFFYLALLLLVFTGVAEGAVITVWADGSGDYPTIQAAIDDANDGDEVVLEPGTYTGEENRDIDFLGKAITVRSIEPNAPNIVAATIIDCNSFWPGFPHRGFYFHNSEDSNSVLDGLTIKNGLAPMDMNNLLQDGGGILIENSSPTIRNCIISNNESIFGGAMGIHGGRGGGICCYNDANALITNCTFISNNSNYAGAGIACCSSSPTINNCIFSGNSSNFGGGIFCEDNSNPLIINCTIRNNSTSDCGAGICCFNSNPAVLNCTISENYTDNFGGGILCNSSSPTLTSCLISANSAHNGGGMYNDANSSPTFRNSLITANMSGQDGAGIYNIDCNVVMVECTFRGNLAYRYGGGICSYGSSLELNHCRFEYNKGLGLNPRGGGIYSSKSTLKLANCLFFHNTTTDEGGAIYGAGGVLTNCQFIANEGTSGGGVYIYSDWYFPKPTIFTNCQFIRNVAKGSGQYIGGGGLNCQDNIINIINCRFIANSAYMGGGLLIDDSLAAIRQTLTSCIFSGNSASYGGALYNRIGGISVSNCNFVSNYAHDMVGGIINTPKLTNCVLWGNSDKDGGGLSSQLTGYYPPHINYCSIEGWANDVGGIGNIDADPCFVELGYWSDVNDPNIIVEPNDPNAVWSDGDYHLLSNSPCIDTGDPNYEPEPNETDLDGNPRVLNGRIDMGAYEYSPPVQVELKLTPQMLSCDSRGKWVKAHVTFPEEIFPEDIDVNTPAVADPPGVESEFIEVNEYADGTFDVQIYFDRESFCQALSESEDSSLEVTVTGSLTDGRKFEGSDTIKLKTQMWQNQHRKNKH